MSKITLPEAVQFLIDANIEGVHTSIPGIVTSYDGHKTRRATVQPSVRLPSSNGVLMDIPPIGGVPVVFPSSALGTLFFPINPGDGVTLVFSEVGIGRYLQSDGSDLADPGSLDRHALTDAIAIPGLWTWSSAPEFPASATMDAVVLVSGNGSIVELGATVGIRNAQTDLRAELETIYAELDQLVPHLRGPTVDRLRSIMAVHYGFETRRLRLFVAYISASFSWTADHSVIPLGQNVRFKGMLADALLEGLARGEVREGVNVDTFVEVLLAAYIWNYRLISREGADVTQLIDLMDRQIGVLFEGVATH